MLLKIIVSLKKITELKSGVVVSLISALGIGRQVCEWEASLVYTASFGIDRATSQRNPVSKK